MSKEDLLGIGLLAALKSVNSHLRNFFNQVIQFTAIRFNVKIVISLLARFVQNLQDSIIIASRLAILRPFKEGAEHRQRLFASLLNPLPEFFLFPLLGLALFKYLPLALLYLGSCGSQ